MSVLSIDTGCYLESARHADSAARATLETVSAAAGSLQGSGGMAGWDAAGADWAAAYDPAAQQVLRTGGELVRACSDTARVVTMAAGEYIQAEHVASMGVSALIVPVVPGILADGSPAFLPPAVGGNPGIPPPGWDIVAGVAGVVWPSADTPALRSAAASWNRFADGIDGVRSTVMASVPAAVAGLTARDLEHLRERSVLTSGAAVELTGAARHLAAACGEYAASVEEAHAELAQETLLFVAECALITGIGAGLSFITLGGSAAIAGIVGAARVAQLIVRVTQIFGKLAATASRAKAFIQSMPAVAGLASRSRVLQQAALVRIPGSPRIVQAGKTGETTALSGMPAASRLAPAVTVVRPLAAAGAKVLDSRTAALLADGPVQLLKSEIKTLVTSRAFGPGMVKQGPQRGSTGTLGDSAAGFGASAAGIGATIRSSRAFKAVKWTERAKGRFDTALGLNDRLVNGFTPQLAAGGAHTKPRIGTIKTPPPLTAVAESPHHGPREGSSQVRQRARPAALP